MKKALLLIPACFCMLMAFSGEPSLPRDAQKPVFSGNFLSFEKIPGGVEIKAENAVMIIQWFSPALLNIRTDRTRAEKEISYAVIEKPKDVDFRLTESPDRLEMISDSLQVVINKIPLRLIIKNSRGQVLSEEYAPFCTGWLDQSVTTYRKLFSDEKFVGLGEKTGNLNKRGSSYTNWNSDVPAYLANQDPLYQTIPFFIGFHDEVVYGIFLDNSCRTTFNFGASTDELFSSFSAASGTMNYYFFGASTPAGIIRDYTWLTGRMPMPPIWSLGYQQCRWSYYPESEVMSIAKSFRDKKIPCDMIYLDIDYMDSYKIFTWNKDRFPDPASMISKLNAMGFHLATIVDPGIKVEKGYFAYDEGVANGYFAKYPDGTNYIGSVWPGRCHFPDFTNPKVRTWWGNAFSRLSSAGVEGFWNDMNEPSAWGQSIPEIVQFDYEGKGASMSKVHNVYGLNMARATFEGTKKLMNGKRPFILTRAGYAGIQRYSAVWTGDNEASDEHMLLSARMVTGLGLSGVSFTGPDLGGFIGNPSKELYSRWLSLGVFTPFFRNHSAWDTKSKEPWSFGRDAENLSRKLISLRYTLLPYIYSAFYESAQTGMPVARSLVITDYKDEKVWWWAFQNQYLFGGELLVAPVSCEQNYARVYLPRGGWYRLSSGEFFTGGREVIVPAPMDDLPVFVRASGILPMQSAVQYTAEKPSDTIDIHVYKGTSANTFVYYEDDGTTYRFEKGEYFLRNISYDPSSEAVKLGTVIGKGTSKFTHARLVLHGFSGTLQATVNGKDVPAEKSAGGNISLTLPFVNEESSIRFTWK